MIHVVMIDSGIKPPTTDEYLQLLRVSGFAAARAGKKQPIAVNDKAAALVALWRLLGKSAAARARFAPAPGVPLWARAIFFGCYRNPEWSTGMLVAKWLVDGVFDFIDPRRGHWKDGCVGEGAIMYQDTGGANVIRIEFHEHTQGEP